MVYLLPEATAHSAETLDDGHLCLREMTYNVLRYNLY